MADVDWPLPNDFKPVLDRVRRAAPNKLRRTAMEDGPDRIRQVANFRPHVFTDTFEINAADTAILRRWIEEDLGEGALWFNLNAYVDGSYTWVEARIIALEENLLELTPAGDRHMQFTLTYEVRELPRAADEAYFAALVGGADQLAAMISELDLAVNTDLKAAAT